MGSAHPLCRWPNSSALRGLSRWTLLETVKLPAIPLIEFRLRVGLCPVLLSRLWRCRSAPLVGFFFPSAHAATKVHFMRVLPYPLSSALRVWLPSRRLTPFEASPALFRASSALGKSPSERSPLRRCPDVSVRANSPTVSPSGFSAAKGVSPARWVAVPEL